MNELISLNTATQSPAYLVNRSVWWGGCLLIPLACFAALMTAQAAPDGDVGNGSTAEGAAALASQTSGSFNTALGLQALFSDTNGFYNTGTGVNALYGNTGGAYNTANGGFALFSNTTGNSNTATGVSALVNNNIGSYNTAMGLQALFSNTSGTQNTGTGVNALYHNTTGTLSTATGVGALFSNTTGTLNTAAGVAALFSNTTGTGNAAIGTNALYNITTGSNNVAVGNNAGTGPSTASNVIAIGTPATGPFANSSFTCFIGSIHNEPVSDPGTAQAISVDQFNVLGMVPSSRRFKHDIKPMDKASETILALKPVTFKYNSDKKGTPQYGLIAEAVAEVNPDLILRDNNGEIASVRYEQINAMLLNEFLKEHRTVQDLKKEVAALIATVKEQASQIKKVSDRLERSRPAPEIVADNQ
jgi:hypothetical protein